MEAADNKELFESQWRQAFDGVSVSPPPMVWERIESKLATQKEHKYKKAIFYYRWAAAAMTTVAVGLGTILLFQSPTTEVVVTSAPVVAQNDQVEMTSEPVKPMKSPRPEAKLPEATVATSGASIPQMEQPVSSRSTALLAAAGDSDGNGDIPVDFSGSGSSSQNAFTRALDRPAEIGAVTSLNRVSHLESNLSVVKVDHLYGVARPVMIGKKVGMTEQPLIAGLGVGGGTFDPNYGFRSGSAGLFNFASADQEVAVNPQGMVSQKANEFNYAAGINSGAARSYSEAYEQGGSFSFGANLGKRIFRRLIVHTGVQYGRYGSSGRSSVVLEDDANNRKFVVNQASVGSADVQEVFSSGQYSYLDESPAISNTYEFISVPVKLGVILLDRRTGIVLNTGISNEFLVSNLIRAKDEGYEDVRTKSGKGSAYRSVYLNGTLGLEVNYAISSHYKIVVEPYYRHALTALTKNTEGYTSTPRLWGIQAGVRYELR